MQIYRDKTIIGMGYDLAKGDPEDIKEIFLMDSERSGHIFGMGTTRFGKAQSLDSLIHTPDGFKRMGDIKKGDIVSTPDNKTATVIDIFPQGILPLYKITLEDGRTAEASGDHLWEVYIGYSKKKKKTIVTTDLLRRIMQTKKVFIQVCNPSKKEKLKLVAVKSINFSRNAEAQCILLDSPEHLYITDNYIVTHNTRLMESMIEQDLRKGNSVIFIDPKSDYDIFSKIVQVAFEENREDEIMYLSVIPDNSIKFNPLSHFLIPDEMVHHTVSGIEAKDQFFINVAYETSLAIASSLYMIKQANGNKEQLNFSDILYYVSQADMKDLRNTLEKAVVEQKYVANQRTMLHLLDQIIASPTDYFSKVSTTLRTMLTQLTSGNMGTVMGLARENPVIDRLEAGKRIILIVHTHALSTRKVSYLMARNVLSSIQSFIGRVFEQGLKINPPLCLYIDEASNVFYDGIENMFNKAGGAGVWLAAFTQSVSDITAELGIDRTKKIIDNTNTKIYLRVNDPDTQRFVSQSSGLIKGYSHIIGLGGSFTLKQEEIPLVSTDIIGNLKKREMLFLGPDGRYKGMTLFTKPSYVNITNKKEEKTNQAISSISQSSGKLDLSDKASGKSVSGLSPADDIPKDNDDWMWNGKQVDKPAPLPEEEHHLKKNKIFTIFNNLFKKTA
jgi:hypothetical protein